MGCDYYIIKKLIIVINQNETEKTYDIEINRERCYFLDYNINDSNDSNDSDDSSYNDKKMEKWKKMIEKCLQVKYEPKILYENNQWKSDYIRKKYEYLIQNKNINEKIKKITKMEVRELRY